MAWRAQHRAAAISSWQKLMARPFSTALIWLVVAISLSLPSTLLLTLDHVWRLAPDLSRGAHMSVMLKSELDMAAAQGFERRVRTWAEVIQVDFIPRDRALTEFGEQTGLSGVLASLERNPLPHTVLIAPAADLSDDAVTALVERVTEQPEVERVILDTRWMARLQEVLLTGWRWVTALGAAMVLGAVLGLALDAALGVALGEELAKPLVLVSALVSVLVSGLAMGTVLDVVLAVARGAVLDVA